MASFCTTASHFTSKHKQFPGIKIRCEIDVSDKLKFLKVNCERIAIPKSFPVKRKRTSVSFTSRKSILIPFTSRIQSKTHLVSRRLKLQNTS
jgi:hypothetical protein